MFSFLSGPSRSEYRSIKSHRGCCLINSRTKSLYRWILAKKWIRAAQYQARIGCYPTTRTRRWAEGKSASTDTWRRQRIQNLALTDSGETLFLIGVLRDSVSPEAKWRSEKSHQFIRA